MNPLKTISLTIFITLLSLQSVFTQQVLIDQGIRAAGLWCFPLHQDSLTYLYLPSRSRLAYDEAQNPKFSFLRYVYTQANEGDEATASTISEAAGGGILHFLVLYDTPEDMIKKAEAVLREKLDNDEIQLRGPIIFDKGRYSLISSILTADGKEKKEMLISGEAPVLEGSRIALSFQMTPRNSKLLLESFKMATPDVSLVFDLSFSGLTDSYDAHLEVDWTEVKNSQAYSAGGSIYFVGADVEVGFDKLRRDNAIKLTSNGSHESMEGLVTTVYDKLLKLMFEPVQPEQLSEEERGGLGDDISSMIGPGGMLNSRNTTGFGLNVGYKLKMAKTEGVSVMDFKGRSTVERHHYITFNASDLYQKYGNDTTIFKEAPLGDPTFQQRTIFVGVDGKLEREFKNMINSVTVTLRKNHQGGSETLREVVLKRNTFDNFDGSPISMIYGSDQDADRIKWLDYDYQAHWQFQGGAGYKTGWRTESGSMINLYTPYQHRDIELMGDIDRLKKEGIRAVIVQIKYDFFDEEKSPRLMIRTDRPLADQKFSITLPNDQEAVPYKITWVKSDGDRIVKEGDDDIGIILIDEIY